MFRKFLAIISKNGEVQRMIVTANSIEAAVQTIYRRESSKVTIINLKDIT